MRNEPFSSFYFRLTILDTELGSGSLLGLDASFQEVSGMSAETKTEEVVCGGENRFVYQLPTTTKYANLILKRGVCPALSPLRIWCTNTLTSGLDEQVKPKDLLLTLLNENGIPSMTWRIHKAYPVKWQASDLNSEKNQLMVETMELSYRYFELLVTPSLVTI